MKFSEDPSDPAQRLLFCLIDRVRRAETDGPYSMWVHVPRELANWLNALPTQQWLKINRWLVAYSKRCGLKGAPSVLGSPMATWETARPALTVHNHQGELVFSDPGNQGALATHATRDPF